MADDDTPAPNPEIIRLSDVSPDLTEEIIDRAVRRGQAAYEGTTTLHPPTYRGLTFWGEATAGLRLELANRGWSPDDTKNFSTIVDPTGKLAIALATADAGTGEEGPGPRLKYSKGDAVQYAVAAGQGDLFLGFAENGAEDGAPEIWFLLVHRTRSEIRCELSKPTSMTEDGHVPSWDRRVLLPSIDLDPEPIDVPADGPDAGGDDVDVVVTKKRK